MNNFFLQNIQFVKLNDTQIFSSKLCYDNVDDYNVFQVAKSSSIEGVVVLIFLNNFTKIKLKIKNDPLLSNKVFLKTFIKLLEHM